MSSLKAIIFDVDGTLADTERHGHRVAFNRAFHEFDVPWDWDENMYAQLLAITGGKERIRHYVEHYVAGEEIPTDLTLFTKSVHARKTEIYVDMACRGQILLRPGVERLISDIKDADVRIAIATTTTLANVIALFTATLGLEALDWFEVIGAGDMVDKKKPAPDIYHYVLDKLGLPAHSCMAIEDSANGLQSSLAANLCTVITANAYTRDDNFKGAALVVDGIGTPESPFACLQGNAYGAERVGLPLLSKLLAASHSTIQL
ncbi:MAG: HAD-IA family hydrolase [Granulosicoccaceae bacterium]